MPGTFSGTFLICEPDRSKKAQREVTDDQVSACEKPGFGGLGTAVSISKRSGLIWRRAREYALRSYEVGIPPSERCLPSAIAVSGHEEHGVGFIHRNLGPSTLYRPKEDPKNSQNHETATRNREHPTTLGARSACSHRPPRVQPHTRPRRARHLPLRQSRMLCRQASYCGGTVVGSEVTLSSTEP